MRQARRNCIIDVTLAVPCIVMESTVIYIDSGGDRLSLFCSIVHFFGVCFLAKLYQVNAAQQDTV